MLIEIIILKAITSKHTPTCPYHSSPIGNPPATTAGALAPRALCAVTLNLSSAHLWTGALG